MLLAFWWQGEEYFVIKTGEHITKAAICLHNFLRQTNSALYCPTGFVDSVDGSGDITSGEWGSIVPKNARA